MKGPRVISIVKRNLRLWLKLVLCIGIECFCIFGGLMLGAVSTKLDFSYIYLSLFSKPMLIYIVLHVDSKRLMITHNFPNSKLEFKNDILHFCKQAPGVGFNEKQF